MGEAYQLSLRGSDSFLVYLGRDHFTLSGLSPGKYNWTVAVVRSTASDEYVAVSEQSDSYDFEILPPAPVVKVISPTSTFQGTSVPVVVSGENLTHSLALTIGVPLQATFVDTSTITATIPITLEVGEYPVIVRDSLGQGDSYAFFIVSEPIPPPLPSKPSPWNPATPIPSVAPPGYDPHLTCVVESCAPAPQLVGPENGVEVRFSSTIHLQWMWDYCLPPEWKFAIRISDASPPHSYRFEDNPLFISCQDGRTIGRYPVGKEFTAKPGTYYWNIAVVRSVDYGGWERLSGESEIRVFTVVEPSKD